jgi:hypothetical protein
MMNKPFSAVDYEAMEFLAQFFVQSEEILSDFLKKTAPPFHSSLQKPLEEHYYAKA